MTEELMTASELANYLKVDIRTVYRYLKEAQLPALRMEGRWRFRQEAIDQWLLQRSPAETRQPPTFQIMVVDDNEIFRSLLLTLLQETPGYAVQGAKDGEEALALCQTMAFDLLITDLQMPRMDGLTLIRHVKRLYPHTRTIIVTGFGAKENAIEALRFGVNEYLEKPIRDLQAFRSVVARVLTS
jgi:excisionase family DNA binding protein